MRGSHGDAQSHPNAFHMNTITPLRAVLVTLSAALLLLCSLPPPARAQTATMTFRIVAPQTCRAACPLEIHAEVIAKATRVDGVYSDDPEVNPHAVRYEKLTYGQVMRDNLRVMEASAVALCRDNHIPIVVFNIREPGNLAAVRCPEMRAAPLAGAPLRKPRQAWLPSVHLLCQPARPLPVLPGLTRLPRLVARGYLAAVPGRSDVRTTVLRRNPRTEKTPT